MKKQSRHLPPERRCYPIDVDLGAGGYGEGWVIGLLKDGVPTDDETVATHVQAYIDTGTLKGKTITFPMFDGALQEPTLH